MEISLLLSWLRLLMSGERRSGTRLKWLTPPANSNGSNYPILIQTKPGYAMPPYEFKVDQGVEFPENALIPA